MSATPREYARSAAPYDTTQAPGWEPDKEEVETREKTLEKQANTKRTDIEEGQIKHCKLGWQRLTICLIVEAIALGSLSMPSAFASLGMVAGVVVTVGIGILAMYASYTVGQVKLRHNSVQHYADAVGLMWGRFGYELTSVMFVLFLVLVTGSHALTGTIAWIHIVDDMDTCALVWGILSAILLYFLALPPTFHEFAILGYIDFASIIIAIIMTMVSTGVQAANGPGGLAAVPWSAWPPADIGFTSAFLAITNIVFAYAFAVCQYSFMAEMHTPSDYVKSITALGTIEIFIYTLTGAIIYAFVGADVASPALLSGPKEMSRITFGIALPVIFISGSINTTVVGKYIMGRVFPTSELRFINTKKGWAIWLGLIAGLIVIAWVVAEAIPFFGALLGIISSLFCSAFGFTFPALFWFCIVKEGKWNANAKNIGLTILNVLVFLVGFTVFVCGAYASVDSILQSFAKGSVGGSFACSTKQYVH